MEDPKRIKVDFDQTAQIRRLIVAFGRTFCIVGNTLPQLQSLRKHAYSNILKISKTANKSIYIQTGIKSKSTASKIP